MVKTNVGSRRAGNHNNGHNEPINDAAQRWKPPTHSHSHTHRKTVNKRGLNA